MKESQEELGVSQEVTIRFSEGQESSGRVRESQGEKEGSMAYLDGRI